MITAKQKDYNQNQNQWFSGSSSTDFSDLIKEYPTVEFNRQQFFPIPDLPDYKEADGYANAPTFEETFFAREDQKEGNGKAPVFVDWPVIQNRFIELQKWEGTVIQVFKESYTARLIDLTEERPDEEAEFSFDEIHDEDIPLVEPGAIFYWSIGYPVIRGQRFRASVIRFRRLPKWSEEEIITAAEEAEYLEMLLD